MNVRVDQQLYPDYCGEQRGARQGGSVYEAVAAGKAHGRRRIKQPSEEVQPELKYSYSSAVLVLVVTEATKLACERGEKDGKSLEPGLGSNGRQR